MEAEKKVLIVEDEEIVREILSNAINSYEKATILETDNLEEALELMKKHQLYALSIDGEFYENKNKITKGIFCNELAKEARKYNIKNIIGLSASPKNLKPELFSAIFDKSIFLLTDYVKALLK